MRQKKLISAILAFICMATAVPSQAQENPAAPFIGMWALDLNFENNKAGWLEVTQEDGYLDAEILWRWGSVYPVDYAMIFAGDLLLVHGQDKVVKKDDKGNVVRTLHPVYWLDVKMDGVDRITGEASFPNPNGIETETVAFTGKRIPALGKAPDTGKIKFGKQVDLFNGTDLKGWELMEKNATSGWKVVDRVLVNDPVQPEHGGHISYGNLRTSDTFEDFKLEVEVNVPKGSNSGVYLRGIYEVQVMDSYGHELDSHNMGALYSRITPLVSAEKPAGEWQTLEITLYKRYLTVILNGQAIIKNQPVKGVTGGALTWDEFSPGPIYLQGDHGKVSYRKVILTPILN
ncbi:MAG: DUF1080 domain-containing protein [Bacteroidota bacterium]